MKTTRLASSLVILIVGCVAPAFGGTVAGPVWEMPPNTDGFTNTPMIPGTPWHVHDPDRPQPPVVVPGSFSTQEKPGIPPSDAIVLFDGTDLSQWQNQKGEPAKWKIENSELIESPTGDITTRKEFGDIQLHVEFTAPPPKGDSQGRGNSGVYLMGKYEVQILDSYKNPTYADGALGALYGQHPPLAIAPRPPGEWQVYDIAFHPPRFDEGGALKSPAFVTVFLNGVLIQDHQSYRGPSGWKQVGNYAPQPPTGPITLQDHHNATRFRNIWVRELKNAE